MLTLNRRRNEKPTSQAAAIHYTKEPKDEKSGVNQNEALYSAGTCCT